MRKTVYIAGPLSTGDRYYNVHNAVEAGRALIKLGLAPLIPHLTHFADPSDELTWEAWLDVDEAWLVHADAVLHLQGESKGADREVAFAKAHGIPVFESIGPLMVYLETQ